MGMVGGWVWLCYRVSSKFPYVTSKKRPEFSLVGLLDDCRHNNKKKIVTSSSFVMQ